MTPNLVLDVPHGISILAPLPWAGRDLLDLLTGQVIATTPPERGGVLRLRSAQDGDRVLSIGPETVKGAISVHGNGWDAYVGRSQSSLSHTADINPSGPAFAAILAGARLMTDELDEPSADTVCNAFDWSNQPASATAPVPDSNLDLGDIWTIGTGSVGTAALYFLTLFTRCFSTTLIDKDHVEIENLDRSPIFLPADEGCAKVEATAEYLRSVGVEHVRTDPCVLGQSKFWSERQEGRPDVIIAAANENHVRFQIETGMPPVQVYGTTGKNWQASLMRHRPGLEPCSLCVFPDNGPTPPMACATGTVVRTEGKQIDAALPFLSFAAGLMAAVEILKLPLAGYPFSSAPIHLYSRAQEKMVAGHMHLRRDCVCQQREGNIHARMLSGTRYASTS